MGDDLEMVRKCAALMGLSEIRHPIAPVTPPAIYIVSGSYRDSGEFYNPLKNDTQAMALVKRLSMTLDRDGTIGPWRACGWSQERIGWFSADNADLNRAIVECCARLPALSAKP